MPLVDSSAIRSIDYDSELRRLFVEFKQTGLYTYSDVSPEMYEEFMGSDSKGRFFNEKILDKYNVFSHTK